MTQPAYGMPSDDVIRVFVSFDLERDQPLYELLLEQSRAAFAGFEVRGKSEHKTEACFWDDRVRRQIADVDQVIVICGEHTQASSSIYAELRIAAEEHTPYLLLWGQRDIMCTKPMGAPPSQSIYSWTPQILRDRLAYIRRTDRTDEIPLHAPAL